MIHAIGIVRPEVLRLAPYNSGLKIKEVVERYAPARNSKLRSNESPLGPSATVLVAAEKAVSNMRLYPDPAARNLRRALGSRFAVPPERIMVGNGSEDLLAIIARGHAPPR